MMLLTADGLLRTEETVEELAMLARGEPTTINTWYCPMGKYDPDFIVRREVFEEVQNQYKAQSNVHAGARDEYSMMELVFDSIPTGVRSLEREQFIWERMGLLFYGPVEGTPAPNPDPRQLVGNWGDWVMAKFTKHGDEPGLCEQLTEGNLENIAALKEVMLCTSGHPDDIRMRKIEALAVVL